VKYLIEKCRSEFEPEWQKGIDFIEKEELPNRRRALLFLEKLRVKLGCHFPDFLKDEFLFDLLRLFSYSQFLGDFLVRNSQLLPRLKEIYRRRFQPPDFNFELAGFNGEREFMNELRRFKHLQMARVLLRDILSLAPFQELVRDVTLIHGSAVRAALEFVTREMERKYGKPGCGFTVVSMGKAAGFELNYSSDIDLIYVYYSRYGETSGGSYGKLQHHDYFSLLAERLTRLLSERTEEGVCMVVDTRLRPNGTMGPLVNDIEALEQYYTAVARPWERFALLKSRPCAGDLRKTGIEFMGLRKAFVFRKYVDLTLIEEVLRLKELIKAKVVKKGDKVDLKLGEGGIREIEFIVQAFQLIYGGKFPAIRPMNTLSALKKLFNWGFLTEREYEDLRKSYLFLRRAEHMLQVTHFRQTQTFHPESEEAEELARKMGFKERGEFLTELKGVMSKVNRYFNAFFPTGDRKPLSVISVEDLKRRGFVEPEEVKRFIDVLLSMKELSPEEVNRLDVMGERFIDLLFEAPSSKNAMKNLVSFFEKEEGRVFFFSIQSQINALKLLFFLLSTKEFFIKRFRETPELLDYVFLPDFIETPITESAVESFYSVLSNLKLVKNLFEVLALLRYRLGRTTIEEFFKELTSICDFVIAALYREYSPEFSLASLGKHGSREMNVGSDLDLLFFSSTPLSPKPAVRFIKELEELGYEVDTRLRPFGEKGELVFTLNYLKKYLKENARVWERLAFTRFRFLQGTLKEEADEIVNDFLFNPPLDLSTLDEIEKMRDRLEKELGKGRKDIKYAAGGVVDLEFIGYTYQLLIKRRVGNTLDTLKLLSGEENRFSELPSLYRKLREIETEKRLFGDFVTSGDRIDDLKGEVRRSYREFMEWVKSRLSRST